MEANIRQNYFSRQNHFLYQTPIIVAAVYHSVPNHFARVIILPQQSDQQFCPRDTLTVAQLYKQLWQIELFLKWIKQHLRIKTLWNHGERSQNSNLDCCFHLCLNRHYQKTPSFRHGTLHNSTDFEHSPI